MNNSAPQGFEEIEHTADAALRVYGNDWGGLFVNAARGMFSLLADWEDTAPGAGQEISLEAIDGESLLVDWLSELLYLHEMEGIVYTSFEMVSISPTALEAVVRGTDRWNARTVIKAVTFNDLRIEKTSQGYATTIVFDT